MQYTIFVDEANRGERMKKTISVVVPVYNIELYIEECITSILNQTYPYLEIILVDDGSTDSSGAICDKYANEDGRVQVIHKENEGLISARKKGIELATGEFLLFVDGDDRIEKNACEKALSIAIECEADVVRFPLVVEKNACTQIRADKIPVGTYKSDNKINLMENLIYSSDGKETGTNNSVCSQLTKTKLLQSFYNNLDNRLEYGEDFAFVMTSLVKADTICIIENPLYYYRMRETSMTHKSNLNYYTQVNLLYLYLKKIFEKSDYKEVLLPQLDKYMDELILRGINHRFIIPREIRIPEYLIELVDISPKSKIALYGAGIVGKSLYKFLGATKLYSIVGWIDKDWQIISQDIPTVISPEKIWNLEYDVMLIAVKSKALYQNIEKELIENYGVDSKKIIWKEPIKVLDYYANTIM